MNVTGNVITPSAGRHADLLVRGATVMTPSGAEHIDVACEQGQIVALGDLHDTWSANTTLDAAGLHVLPGVIDSQVHFREPGLMHKENLEAGTRGAVLGGVTTIFSAFRHHQRTCKAAFRIGGTTHERAELAEFQ